MHFIWQEKKQAQNYTKYWKMIFKFLFDMEMHWKKPWLVLLGVIILVQVFGISSGCFPEEKRSLLDFKAAYSNDSAAFVGGSPKEKLLCLGARHL